MLNLWWTCIRHEGKKIQKSLDTSDKKLAREIEAKIRIEIIEGKYFDKFIGSYKTFSEMMEKFMNEHATKVSKNMQRNYSASLKHLIPFFGTTKVSKISPKMISEYKVLRRNEDVTPHTFRHTFATRLAQRGVDIYKIAKLLGYKDIRMTQRYAHHCPESLRDGIQVLEVCKVYPIV